MISAIPVGSMSQRYSCLIVGAGFSGTVLACQLFQRTGGRLPVAIVERDREAGSGLAFSTRCADHLLNVAAGNMSAFPGEPSHFVNWLRQSHDPKASAADFVPRYIYGQYLSCLLETTIADSASFVRINDEAVDVTPAPQGFLVRLHSGAKIEARAVVIAVGYHARPFPSVLLEAGDTARYAWSEDALDDIPQFGSVLTLGAGLTAIDQVLALQMQGFRGEIWMMSRHGLLPKSHRASRGYKLDWNRSSFITARELLSGVRREVELASLEGIDWRDVLDSMRPYSQKIWQRLPPKEQQRFLRHLRVYWDIHRHRYAPEVGPKLDELQGSGRLRVVAGTLLRCSRSNGGVTVLYRDRKTQEKGMANVHRIINCTGFDTSAPDIQHPLVKSLVLQGLAKIGPHEMGLDVDESGALLDGNGKASTRLFTIGPVRKGRYWETTAVPEIRVQAADLALHLLALCDQKKETTTCPEAA